MASHTFTIDTPLARDVAFDRLADLTRVPEWDHGVRSSRLVDGGGPGLGAAYEVAVTGFDQQPDILVYRITDYSRPDRFVMVGENATMRAVDTLTLTSTDHGCTLRYEGTLELLGDDPPMTDAQLASVFPKVAAVAESGLRAFLAG